MPEPTRSYYGLASILLEAAVVTADQVDAALERQHETGRRIGETLVEIGAATEEDIGWGLARQLGLPFVDLQSGALDPELLRSLPAGLLYRLQAVPVLRSEEGLSIAFSDPTDHHATAQLEALADCAIRPSVTTPSAIRRVLAPLLGAHTAAGAHSARPLPGDAPVVWDRSGSVFLHFHLHAAQRAGASIIHFVPEHGAVRVYQRRADGLAPVALESPEAHEALLTQLELLGAPVAEVARGLHRVAQLAYPTPGGPVPIEVAFLPHDGSTAVTVRLPAPGPVPATLDALGLEPTDLACVREVLHQPAGLVIVAGPAGSGGSTTLARLLAEALGEARSAMAFGAAPPPAPQGRAVFSLAEPGARGEWAALVAAHEPDVVLLDDMVFDEDVAPLTAGASAGRLVLARAVWGDTFALLEHLASRPHTRSAAASRLQLVLQQRLLPVAAPAAAGRPRGRFEVLVVGEPLRAALRAGAPATTLRELAVASGLRTLEAQLEQEVRSGALDAAVAARALAS